MRTRLQSLAAVSLLITVVAGLAGLTGPASVASAAPATPPPIPASSLPQPPCPSAYNTDGFMCVPYAYMPGGTAQHPNQNTACPPGSHKTMGPVLCFSDSEPDIVAPIAPPASTLPFTGFPSDVLSTFGIAFMLCGALAQLLARRRIAFSHQCHEPPF